MTTITLPSNASMKLFPGNTATEYETQLANPIDLGSGKYEVGLTSIIYPNDFHHRIHIREGKERLYGVGYDRGPDKRGFFSPAAGEYLTVLEMLRSIENQNRNDVKLVASPERHNAVISFTNDVLVEPVVTEKPTTPTAPRGRSRGLKSKEISYQKPPSDGGFVIGVGIQHQLIHLETVAIPGVSLKYICLPDYHPDDTIVNYIHVYSDLIQPREVGGELKPLLRTVVVKGKHDRFQQVEYTKPYYFPLVRNNFQNIKVWLRDKNGGKVRFKNSPLIIELHIRRVATPL